MKGSKGGIVTTICLLASLILIISVACTSVHQISQTNGQERADVNRKAEELQVMSTVPPIQYVDRATAQRELQSYILDPRYGRRTVPTKLDPAHVEEFIRQRLDRKKPVPAFVRSRYVVDYYDLRSVLDHYEKMLDRTEKDSNEFDQSVQSIMILSIAGAEAHINKANDYFEYLVKHQLAPKSYEQLVEAVEVMGAGVNAKLLSDRMAASQRDLQPKIASDREADDEYQRIDQWLNSDLPRSLGDAKLRHQILTLPTPEERIEQFCRTYLGWGENDTIELMWWSARWLRSEARTSRTDLIFALIRKTLNEIEASDLPKEEKEPYEVRAVRAIRFFGGTLTPKERRFLERATSSQYDVLDREP